MRLLDLRRKLLHLWRIELHNPVVLAILFSSVVLSLSAAASTSSVSTLASASNMAMML
jgi:hypothetical protein